MFETIKVISFFQITLILRFLWLTARSSKIFLSNYFWSMSFSRPFSSFLIDFMFLSFFVFSRLLSHFDFPWVSSPFIVFFSFHLLFSAFLGLFMAYFIALFRTRFPFYLLFFFAFLASLVFSWLFPFSSCVISYFWLWSSYSLFFNLLSPNSSFILVLLFSLEIIAFLVFSQFLGLLFFCLLLLSSFRCF